jgi:roadblock/LC7 domain-containing protein
MANLDQLMAIDGALAAFEMNARGELQQHRVVEDSAFDERTLDLLGHMCVANMAIATMQARGWEASFGNQGFYPVNGFTLVGLKWSAVTNGCHAVVMSNESADYEKAYEVLGVGGGAA